MSKSSLREYEVSCVVKSFPRAAEKDAVSCSAVFLTQRHVLAPGCILIDPQHASSLSAVNSALAFEVLASTTNLDTIAVTAARCIAVWKCDALSVAVDKLFVNDVQPQPKNLLNEEELHVSLISMFVLLEVVEVLRHVPCLALHKIASRASLGADLLVCSTPFGSSHVESFYNSWNSGLVSKIVEENVLFLSDASCVPGSQGGVVYTKHCMKPLGLVIYPVVWRLEECTGLSMIADISAILDSLDSLDLTLPCLPLYTNQISRGGHAAGSSRVVRVKDGHTWGSGILISKEYVLTCSHVLQSKANISRKVTVEVGSQHFYSTIAFKSQAEDVFDVAILKLSTVIECIDLLPYADEPVLGSKVWANGYGLFGSGASMTLTSGIIAKISTFESAPFKLVTTCKVHAGASGGALVNNNGDVIGMMTANTVDTINKVVYNQVSFGLSLDFMYPSIKKLCTDHDLSGLANLEERLKSDNQRIVLQSQL